MNGANQVSKAVGLTMGPRGRNVMIGQLPENELDVQNKLPIITKGGVTVAKSLSMLNN